MLNIKSFFISASVLLIGFASCQKEELSYSDNFQTEDNAFSSELDSELDDLADAVSYEGNYTGKSGSAESCKRHPRLPGCATITKQDSIFPKEIIIDFGSGCTGRRGRVYSGKLIISLTDNMMNPGAIRTITFEDFAVNNKLINGTKVHENLGADSDGIFSFAKEVNITVDAPKGMFAHEFSGVVKWISGHETSDCGDNVLEISGSGSFSGPKGSVYTNIIEPLLVDQECGYTIDGILELSNDAGKSAQIDYGDGTCDNEAIVIKPDGSVHTIDLDEFKMKRKKRIGKRLG